MKCADAYHDGSPAANHQFLDSCFECVFVDFQGKRSKRALKSKMIPQKKRNAFPKLRQRASSRRDGGGYGDATDAGMGVPPPGDCRRLCARPCGAAW